MRDEGVGAAWRAIGRRADLARRAAVLGREDEEDIGGRNCELQSVTDANNALAVVLRHEGSANSKLWISPESGSRREPLS